MLRFYFTFCMLLLAYQLAAIGLVYPDGTATQINPDSLRSLTLQKYNTTRSSEKAMITETWEGVPLLQLVQGCKLPWDQVVISSKDGYQSKTNRAELSDSSAVLAVVKDASPLSEYDVRVIYPQGHESTWVRNIKQIKLEPLHTLPPKRIYPWSALWDMCGNEGKDKNNISFREIMEKGYCLEQAELVFVGSDGSKFSFTYPKQLKEKYLVITPAGSTAWITDAPGKPNNHPIRLVFMQYGALAFGNLRDMSDIANRLGWNWTLLNKHLAKPTLSPLGKDPQEWQQNGVWVELE